LIRDRSSSAESWPDPQPGAPRPEVAFARAVRQPPEVIASVQFKHFKALRATSLRLEPFNLLIGPNGSGKTSLIQAILRLRTLAQAPASGRPAVAPPSPAVEPPAPHRPNGAPEIIFRFSPPFADIEVHLGGNSEHVLNLLQVRHPPGVDAEARW